MSFGGCRKTWMGGHRRAKRRLSFERRCPADERITTDGSGRSRDRPNPRSGGGKGVRVLMIRDIAPDRVKDGAHEAPPITGFRLGSIATGRKARRRMMRRTKREGHDGRDVHGSQ